MSGRWFRFYDDVLDDPKVQLLSDCLFKTWANLMCLASKSGGKIPMANEVAFRLRISVQDAKSRLDDLILAGLIDIQPDGSMAPHNWVGRQSPSDSSAGRMRKFRSKKREKTDSDDGCDVTRDGCDGKSDAPDKTRQDKRREEIDSPSPSHSGAAFAAPAQEQVLKSASLGKFGSGRQVGVSKNLRLQAEGFGLPVADLVAKAEAPGIGKPSGYFRSLCHSELRRLAPLASTQEIEQAMTGNPSARAKVFAMMMGAAHV